MNPKLGFYSFVDLEFKIVWATDLFILSHMLLLQHLLLKAFQSQGHSLVGFKK